VELSFETKTLDRELVALDRLKLVVVLGKIAMDAYLAARQIRGVRFGHNLIYLYANLDPPLCAPTIRASRTRQPGD
jgi:uracil-DNA glycosylase